MPSTSSSAIDGFRSFVEATLQEVERVQPWYAQRLAACLEGRAVRVEVGADRLLLVAEAGRAAVVDDREDAEVTASCRSNDRTIVELATGRARLSRAIEDGRFRLRGALDDLVALHRVLEAYLGGCVRSPATARMFEAYRQRVEGEEA